MIPIEFKYNGLYHKTITNTFGAALEIAIINKITEKLENLKNDILLEGGRILIKMTDRESYRLEISGVSNELKERVEVAMLLN